jgi:ferredoxin-NADP reductase/Na+-translocating ferredoxin:NAD+ oxidoreductase RnfD subunit
MKLLTPIDAVLNKITSYRLALYYLAGLVLVAAILSALGALPYAPLAIVADTVVAVVACVLVNAGAARLFKAETNVESSVITALILVLIVPLDFPQNIGFFLLASAIAAASKYVLAVDKRHIFNPAAVAVVALSLIWPDYSATWWVGTGIMLPFVAVGGYLVVRKMRLDSMVVTFLAVFLVVVAASAVVSQGDLVTALRFSLLQSAVVFFACIMLTEPFTLPATRSLRSYYAVLIALLYATPQFRIFGLALSPEIALCLGNVFSFAVNPKFRLELKLRRKRQVAADTVAFEFEPVNSFAFAPGQFMEWTLPGVRTDSRGNRRTFTIASSPAEPNVTALVKFPEQMSRFKAAMLRLKKGDTMIASRLAGDFILPRDLSTPIVFLAGGVGLAPFRSMLQHLVDRDLHCNIVLLYMERRKEDFVDDAIFKRAAAIGVKTVYVLTNPGVAPPGWNGRVGRVTAEMIREEASYFDARLYYVSGPTAMVGSYVSLLRSMGIPGKKIITDYFPGFA